MEHPGEFWNATTPDKKRTSEVKLEERFKDHSPEAGREDQSALDDETYPADMDEERSEPKGVGRGKPGPKNPDDVADTIK